MSLNRQGRTLDSNADDVLNAVWIDFERILQHLEAPGSDRQKQQARLKASDAAYPVQLHSARGDLSRQEAAGSLDEGQHQ